MSRYEILERLHEEVDELVVTGWDGQLRSPHPGYGPPADIAVRAAARTLEKLASSMALVVDPARDVREILVLDCWDGEASLSVVNATGKRELVTSFFLDDTLSTVADAWSHCREATSPDDTVWDRARSERRVVDYGGRPSLIDAGVLLVVDMVVSMGCETQHSCEGHPNGAYLTFSGDRAEDVQEAFEAAGWLPDRAPGEWRVVRMPAVDGVYERDEIWRETCETLVARLGPPGRSPERAVGP